MASPKRFVPVNAVLALLREHDEWPPVLARAGFRLAGLEIPTTTPLGSTTLDVVCHRPADDYLLIAECKSGGNVDIEQARKLSRLDASGISRTASVTLASGMRPRLEVLYVCLDEHVERIERALLGSGLAFSILAIGSTHLGSLGTPCRDTALAAAFTNRIPVPGAPPIIVRFDRESTVQDMLPVVHAELVAGLSHRRDLMTIRMLTERCVPEIPGQLDLLAQEAEQLDDRDEANEEGV